MRDEDPARFAEGVAGRRIEAIGRRGKQVIVDLDGGAFLTIHLKMTGQLFVVPAARPVDPYERLALTLDDGRELRFRDIRKFGRIGLYGADDDPFDGIGPEPLDPRFTLREFRRPDPRRGAPGSSRCSSTRRSSPASATSTPTRRCGARSSTRCAPRGRCGRTTSAPCTANVREILAEAVERRGSSIDDYTAPDGDGEMQERLDVYQRTGLPCRRCGRPIRRIVVGIRATHFCSFCQRLPAAERPAAREAARDDDAAPGPRRHGAQGPPLDGAGRARDASGARPARRRGAGPRGADAAGRGDAAGGGPRERLRRSQPASAGLDRGLPRVADLDLAEPAADALRVLGQRGLAPDGDRRGPGRPGRGDDRDAGGTGHPARR